MKYETVKLSSISKVVETFSDCPSHWIFRGQTDASWSLQPSIERLMSHKKWDRQKLERLEELSVERFRRAAHHYFKQEEQPESLISWLSVMQHHGTPTRLLDFSESALVALFFSFAGVDLVKSSTKSSAIWALDYRAIREITLSKARISSGKEKPGALAVGFNPDHAFDLLVADKSQTYLWVGEPQRANQRLSYQKGTFLIATNFSTSLNDTLSLPIYSKLKVPILTKYEIPHKLKFEVFKFLSSATISSATMYGGLDGFAKDVKLELSQLAA